MAANGKIMALNNAIRETIPHISNIAADNPHAEVLVRAIRFADRAEWHIRQATPVHSFNWATDLSADGATAMGAALSLVASELKIPPMSERALPPVLVLVSDSQPTDDYAGGLRTLMGLPWGQKAVRVAVTIGQDADRDVLQEFIGPRDLAPLEANNPEALVRNLRWVSTAVLKAVSQPASQVCPAQGSVVLPVIPDPAAEGVAVTDVW